MTRLRVVAVAICAAMLLSGCGAPITPGALQRSIAAAFGRLYITQQVEVANPRPTLRAIRTHARCVKGTPADVQRGAGSDWVCYITYLAAGPGTPVTATYSVTMQTDGCYAADGDGPASLNGRQTVTGPRNRQLTNPLWLINGCFDVG